MGSGLRRRSTTYKLEPQPWAVTAWRMAPDNRSAEIDIRDDIVLHSGRKWTLDDLSQSLRRAADRSQGLQLNGPMASVARWAPAGPRTLRIEFPEPISEAVFTDLLVTIPVTDATMNTLEQSLTRPSGSGPFRLVSRVPNDNYVLERFDAYWRKGLPLVKRIVINVFDNQDVMISALQSGAIHVANFAPTRAVARLGRRFAVHEGYEGALGTTFRFNVKENSAFGSRPLRQAMFHVVDRERMAREVYNGFATPAHLPWVPASVAHDPAYARTLAFDLDRAKAQIQASGVSRAGCMVWGQDNAAMQKAQIIQADLAKIGFRLEIEPVDRTVLSARFLERKYDSLIANIGNIGKRSPTAVTTNSFMRVRDNAVWGDALMPGYVEAMQRMRSATTVEAERAAAADVNRILAEEAWVVPLVLMKSLTAYDARVTGIGRDTDDRLDLMNATFA